VFWFVAVGFVTGLSLGIVISRRLSSRMLFWMWIITCGLAVFLFTAAYIRYTAPVERPGTPAAVAVVHRDRTEPRR
jgi:hypothetical protein